jgi:hypothetical protein
MKFGEYIDSWAFFKKMGAIAAGIKTREEMYASIIPTNDPLSYRHAMFDCAWFKAKKPYYDVYPSIIPALTRIKLDKIRGCDVCKPGGLENLLLRLPLEGKNELCWDDGRIRAMFVSFQEVNHQNTIGKELGPGITIGIDQGELDTLSGVPIFLLRIFPLTDQSIESTIDALPVSPTSREGKLIPPDIINRAVRLAITVCLLDNDPSIISPEVLSRDRGKEITDVEVNRARRRGKYAFSIGKSFEMIPHYRRPHLAHFWTGKGRTKLIMKMRKGAIVHRDKVTNVPTGYSKDESKD